jgi:hypothetical protein
MPVSRHLIQQPHEQDCHDVCEDDGSHSNSNIEGRDAETEDGQAHRCRYDALLLADVGVWCRPRGFGRARRARPMFSRRKKRPRRRWRGKEGVNTRTG